MSLGGPQPILHFPASNIKSTFYSEIPRKMAALTWVHHKEAGLTCFHVSMKCWPREWPRKYQPGLKGRDWDQESWHPSPVWCRRRLLSSLQCHTRTEARHSLGWPAMNQRYSLKLKALCLASGCVSSEQWDLPITRVKVVSSVSPRHCLHLKAPERRGRTHVSRDTTDQ